ncbi:hypothetical protein B0H19DRAFT_1067980 [Mycena capillaripes]|nr:hypothetical protein B0H19DRAFT_1067980 [Mycena capillaripes]
MQPYTGGKNRRMRQLHALNAYASQLNNRGSQSRRLRRDYGRRFKNDYELIKAWDSRQNHESSKIVESPPEAILRRFTIIAAIPDLMVNPYLPQIYQESHQNPGRSELPWIKP